MHHYTPLLFLTSHALHRVCTFKSDDNGNGGGGSATCRSTGFMILSCRSVVRCDETGITLVMLFGLFGLIFIINVVAI